MRIKAEKGSLLITTLWIVAILVLLASGVGYRMSLELRVAKNSLDRIKAEYAAKAGLLLAETLLTSNINAYDSMWECGVLIEEKTSPEQLFKDIQVGEGSFTLSYQQGRKVYYGLSDEDRKININKADKAVLKALLRKLGKIDSNSEAVELAENIIHWRSENLESTAFRFNKGDQYYESLPYPYKPTHEKFKCIEELLAVEGMTPTLFEKIKDEITIFGDEEPIQVNINTASSKVLSVLAISIGISDFNCDALAERIIEVRSGPDKIDGSEDDEPFLWEDFEAMGRFDAVTSGLSVLDDVRLIPIFKNFFKFSSAYYRIESRGKISGSSVSKTLTVVVKKSNDKKNKFAFYHEQ